MPDAMGGCVEHYAWPHGRSGWLVIRPEGQVDLSVGVEELLHEASVASRRRRDVQSSGHGL
jgi:hypothetical protein